MMFGIAPSSHSRYADVRRFAQSVYAEKLGAAIYPDPEAFAYAETDGMIVGCFGLYRADENRSLVLETYFPGAFEKISGGRSFERRECAELGTRAVVHIPGFTSADISLGLSASLLLYAQALGVQCAAFTSNRTVCALARALGVKLINIGSPDPSCMEEKFRENWNAFFRVRQTCYGFRVECLQKCRSVLRRFEESGVAFDDALAKIL